MGRLYLVWRGTEYEGDELLGIFEDQGRAQAFCDTYEDEDIYEVYSYYVTEEKVIG